MLTGFLQGAYDTIRACAVCQGLCIGAFKDGEGLAWSWSLAELNLFQDRDHGEVTIGTSEPFTEA